ncbi:MAG TPA: hypothetical protein VNL35_10070 [Chloroflexota bacterium]|nr:hypothetical protein [Chloroflexota bacterium]
MKRLHGSCARFTIGLAVAGFCALSALPPAAVQAGPVPTITVAVVPSPRHLHVQGWHFTPGRSVEVHAEYFPMTIGKVKTVTANPVGAFAVNLPVLPLRCGVETIDVSASYNPYVLVSNLVTRKVYFSPCGPP